MDWQIILSPNTPGSINMTEDWRLFQDFEKGSTFPVLRIYTWQPKCITFGYSQKPEMFPDLLKCQKEGWDIVKRPTGGGIVFHDRDEVTYAVIMPKNGDWRQSYRRISETIIAGLRRLGIKAEIRNAKSVIKREPENKLLGSLLWSRDVKSQAPFTQLCFSNLNGYEITYKGEKLIGQAQRLGRKGLLQQGTIKTGLLEKKITFEDLSRALIESFQERGDLTVGWQIP